MDDTVRRQQVVDAYIEGEILRYHRMRMISAAVNKKPGPDASLRKALADPHGKKVFTLAKDLMGAHGMLETNGVLGEEWDRGFLFSPWRSPLAAARARCCATSSPSACSAYRTTPRSEIAFSCLANFPPPEGAISPNSWVVWRPVRAVSRQTVGWTYDDAAAMNVVELAGDVGARWGRTGLRSPRATPAHRAAS